MFSLVSSFAFVDQTQAADAPTITSISPASGSAAGGTNVTITGTSFTVGNLGTGSDGSVTISANKNINTDTIASSRTCADAINYSITALTSNTATLSTTPAAGCLAAGDEVLLINLQGISTNYANVGNYETLRIQSITDNVITFTTNKTKYYGNSTSDDINIGTATTNQRVMLQRVPNYADVTISNGYTLTANAWNGTKGGVLYFKATGTVTNNGTIDMTGKGYRYGQYGYTIGGQYAYQGESYPKFGSASQSANFGGGGAYPYSCCGGGGGGAYGADGIAGDRSYPSYLNDGGGAKGISYGDQTLDKLFFGSGGGGGTEDGGQGQNGGSGGGIVFIEGWAIENGSNITSKGNNGTNDGWGAGGGGSGGSIKINGGVLNIGTNGIQADGGVGGVQTNGGTGGDGGNGRVALYYADVLSGSASGSVYSELDTTIKRNVVFGGSSVRDLRIVDSNTITFVTPSHVAGLVDVTVTNYDGQSATLSNAFTCITPPTITSITPNSSLRTGGDAITITGTDFYGTPTVTIGGTAAINVTLVNSTTITAATPAHTIGTVDVVVTNPDGQTSTLSNGFTYNELPPTITSITPNFGPIAGGTSVTITGSNYISGGNDANTSLLLHADGSGTSFVDSSVNAHTVVAHGSATQSTAQSKLGGSSIYLNGSSSFLSIVNPAKLNLGNNDFTVDTWLYMSSTLSSTTTLFDVGPAGSGGVARGYTLYLYNGGNIAFDYANSGSTISASFGSSSILTANTWHHVALSRSGTSIKLFIDGSQYGSTYTYPYGTGITDALSTEYFGLGGFDNSNNGYPGRYWVNGYVDEFRISKGIARWTSNFTPPISAYTQPNVTIGGSQATNIIHVNATTITATTPAHAAGATDVTVTNCDGQSATLANGFTFTTKPVVSSINPASATKNGNRTVTISGSNFYGTPTVSLGGTAAVSVTLVDSATLSVVVPAHVSGIVDVVVANPLGEITTLANSFTYTEPEMLRGTIRTVGRIKMNQ